MKALWVIFWVLVGVFVVIIGTMFVGVPLAGNFQLGFIVFPAWIVFLGLGITLIVLIVKKQVEGKLKKFLLLTGASAVGLPVFAVLHNLVSALFNTEEPVFFILATMVCPLGFLAGAIGTIVLASKNKPSVPSGTS